MRSKGSAAELERRRLLAVRRVLEGRPAAEVARFLEVHERTVRKWVSRAVAWGGSEGVGLAAKPQVPLALKRPAEANGGPATGRGECAARSLA